MAQSASITRTQMERVEKSLPGAFYTILSEVQLEAKRLSESPRNGIVNPFTLDDPREWKQAIQDRYKEASKLLGQNYMIVAWYSATFRAQVQRAHQYMFKRLMESLQTEKGSLMMIAITNGLDPPDDYNASVFAQELGLGLKRGAFIQKNTTMGIKHPHEAYLAIDGSWKQCMYTNTKHKTSPMVNIEESIYDRQNFAGFPRINNDWPEQDGWPPKWKYPSAPYESREDLITFPRCEVCKRNCNNPRYPGGEVSPCGIKEVLVEVKQYNNLPGDKKPLNRGVRSLGEIQEGKIIGEYCGEFIPSGDNAQRKFGDDSYVLEFHGPPLLHESGRVKMKCNETGSICVVVSGQRGTWSRFINHSNVPNVSFWACVHGPQIKVVIKTIKDIDIGEEITANYGENYFTGNDMPKEKVGSMIEQKRKSDYTIVSKARQSKKRRTS